ncbi:MAG TPA: acyltransferase [Iamia sp.]|nr:acyltransferase [Iamia sp.]
MHGRIRELDGLRGVAIALVVVGHMWSGLAPHHNRLVPGTRSFSGFAFFGVTLFFVLSGFLITRLLVREQQTTGTIHLTGFYARRARRLLPALVTLAGVYLVYAAIAGQPMGEALGATARSLLYVENIGDLLHIPTSGWLEHTWSLAVEEQFYLVWPAVVVVALRRGSERVAMVAIGAAVATMVIRVVVGALGPDLYGVLHTDALMVGALLAVVPWKPSRPVCAAAIGVVLAQTIHYLTRDGYAPMTDVQYLIYTGASAVFVASAPSLRWLRSRVLVHLGTISYGLYLWHAVLMRFDWPTPAAVVAAVAFAEVSYYGIERRFLASRPAAMPAHPIDEGTIAATVPAT